MLSNVTICLEANEHRAENRNENIILSTPLNWYLKDLRESISLLTDIISRKWVGAFLLRTKGAGKDFTLYASCFYLSVGRFSLSAFHEVSLAFPNFFPRPRDKTFPNQYSSNRVINVTCFCVEGEFFFSFLGFLFLNNINLLPN